MPLPQRIVTERPPREADIAIIGGGVAGLALAYYLARIGYPGRVVVLEQHSIFYGSTTRNAGRFRVHFFSRENTVFARESARRILEIPRVTGVNPVIARRGYLWLVQREDSLEKLRKVNREIWEPLGVPVRFLEIGEVAERHPYINLEGFVAGVFGPQNGSLHHDYMSMALASYAARHGVAIVEGARVERILVNGSRVAGVHVEGFGSIRAGTVVVAAGSWSRRLLQTAGVDLPLDPVRKSLLVTEPYRYTIGPLVIVFEEGSYIGQTLKGEVIATGKTRDPKTLDFGGVSLEWLRATARLLARLLKGGSCLRILRAWSGTYNVTPDHSHVLGRGSEWPEGLYVDTGYSGHGLMMAPYAGELLAKLIAEDKEHPHMKPYNPDRFREGRLIPEGLVLG
ncbi:NAD(P)/FAD-dependent oxidoreductase [Hyperthermus butylicus]|uniref:Sarcosine dehydrogenase beta subunit n=1 Tax=Hyperthermus butylicus (strain DSM 5456 / JCM 9403 / PLM1-5) TaxID=415426 RepID=A2BKH1_HYPBU|nr:FAD-binding oxidoreductase [Hyperthermus butylicus]ABM80482.1 Sarcosine dehydrogenase beta subunit [Hyperthermus butylicus DSM 5456]